MFSNKHTTLYYLLKVTYKIIYKNLLKVTYKIIYKNLLNFKKIAKTY